MLNNPVLLYYAMLSDQVRMKAYQQAIYDSVKPGQVVVDIGTGSGILAFLAVRAGAQQVYAIEKEKDIFPQAARLARANGVDQQITFINKHSSQVELAEKVDVVLSEVLGHFGLEEGVLTAMLDARQRFLKNGGTLIPAWMDLYLVPVEIEPVWQKTVGFWGHDLYGFDFESVRQDAFKPHQATDCSGASLLAAPSKIAHYNFYEMESVPAVFDYEAAFTVTKAGTLHGLVGYFETGLTGQIVISTSPEAPKTHWDQTFFFIDSPAEVEVGDRLSCRLKIRLYSNEPFWYWKIVAYRNGVELFRSSQASLNSPKETSNEPLAPDFKPQLVRRGQIRRRVFALCDGNTTVAEIAQALCAEFPEKFHAEEKARLAVINILQSSIAREEKTSPDQT